MLHIRIFCEHDQPAPPIRRRWTEVKPGVLISRRVSSLSRLVRTPLLWILYRHIKLAGLLRVSWWIELTWLLRVLRRCIKLARGWRKSWSLELLGILLVLIRDLVICIPGRLRSERNTHVCR